MASNIHTTTNRRLQHLHGAQHMPALIDMRTEAFVVFVGLVVFSTVCWAQVTICNASACTFQLAAPTVRLVNG
jgi:hypothetical protein